ncbi:hypothetical protein, partial [Paenibacillus sp. SI8]|uniref:hypothetical protein n=1 Tax=Paenibacillus sp. SI8 TaxID=3163026 RepID=UPI00346535CF
MGSRRSDGAGEQKPRSYVASPDKINTEFHSKAAARGLVTTREKRPASIPANQLNKNCLKETTLGMAKQLCIHVANGRNRKKSLTNQKQGGKNRREHVSRRWFGVQAGADGRQPLV